MNYKTKAKNLALTAGMTLVGAVAGHYLGKFTGEVIEHIPYLSNSVIKTIETIANIDLKENLDGLGSLVGTIYGTANSGTVFSKDKPKRIEKIKILGAEIDGGW